MFSRRRHRAQQDLDLDDEIRAHFAMAVADRIARGESPEEAAAAARREFGNIGHVMEVTRDMWGSMWWDCLRQDVAYAFRSLRRAPGFATAAVLTFALGIGVNTAMFTVVNAVLLRPLPFHDAGALYLVSHKPSSPMFARETAMLDRQFVLYRDAQHSFESMASYNAFQATMIGAGDPVRLSTTVVTPGFFSVLGVSPSIGRVFTTAEHTAGDGAKVVMLSDALWRERFSASRDALGKSISVDGEQRTIVGVMPPTFDLPGGTQLWYPTEFRYNAGRVALRPVVGRLAPGVTVAQAQRELEAIVKNIERDRPDDRLDGAVTEIIPLRDRIVGDVQRSLLLFAGAVAFVLLIACANVANLLIMRASTRQHEIGIRAAIGANRLRLIRQLLTESLVLSFAGGVLGLAIAAVGVRVLLSMAPPGLIPRIAEIHIDATVLGVTSMLCAAAGLGFGIVPAIFATRGDLRAALGGRGTTGGARRARLRNALVTAECALAIVLLVGAGLLMRSFVRLQSVDLGFHANNVVTFMVDLPANRYSTPASMQQFRERTQGELAKLPGVTAVAAVNWRPLSNNTTIGDFQREDGQSLPPEFTVLKPSVTASYFKIMGIKVRSGRTFLDSDDERAPGVVVVSRLVADKLWPNGDALGKRISMEDKPTASDWLTIVGIVDDIVQYDVKDNPTPAIYQPLAQQKRKFMLNHLAFAAQSDGDPTRLEQAIRGVIRGVDPMQPVQSIMSMQSVIAMSLAEPLFQTRLLVLFAVLAVLLAAVGLYGVLAYAVTERTQEIGVRVALGATPDSVAWLVVRRTLMLVVPGILAGLLVALSVTHLMSKLLYGVSATDPWTFALVGVVLGLVAIVASVTPARRATRIDPMTALRME